MKRIGIDISNADAKSIRGQAMASLNLLRGLSALETDEIKFVVICNEEMKPIVESICDGFEILTVKKLISKSSKAGDIIYTYIATLLYNESILKRKIKKANLDAIIFMHDLVSVFNFQPKLYKVMNPQDCGPVVPIKNAYERPHPCLSILWSMYGRLRYYFDFKHMDKIIAISNDDLANMMKYLPQFEYKYNQIYIPIDTDNIPIVLSDLPKKKTIVVLNYVYPHKNGIVVIKAFEQIMSQIPHRLVMIGNKNDECSEYVKNNKLSDRVILTGRVEDSVRNKFMAECELYISATEYEGFGMPTIEAILQCPRVLLSDISVNREIGGNIANYYGKPRDIDALSHSILDVLNCDKLITDIQKKETKIKFSQVTIAKEYLRLVDIDNRSNS